MTYPAVNTVQGARVVNGSLALLKRSSGYNRVRLLWSLPSHAEWVFCLVMCAQAVDRFKPVLL